MKRLALLLALLAGCATASADLKTMTGKFEVCAKADLGQIVGTQGKTLLEDVAAQIAGASVSLEATLAADAVVAGVDALECAVTAVESTLTAGSGSGSAVTPALARAKAVVATIKTQAGV